MVEHLTAPRSACALCAPNSDHRREPLLWHDDRLRVIRAHEPRFPGFLRVIWHAHVREMTDLAAPDRLHVLETVNATERVLRDLLRPDKINLASLGNMVPHLHWHIIARFEADPAWPNAIWADPDPDGPPIPLPHADAPVATYRAAFDDLLGPSNPRGG